MGRFKLNTQHVSWPHRRTSALTKGFGVLFLFFISQFLLLQLRNQQALKAKYTATEFGQILTEAETWAEQPRQRDELLAARADWKHLGSGFEGSTFIWKDQVIKTFDPTHSPLRNCAPRLSSENPENCDADQNRWPTEIPASLLLGKSEANKPMNETGFLTVTDFFSAPVSESGHPEWHLVTPLMAGGTLVDLGRRIVDAGDIQTVRDLDVRFRPAFLSLLSTLEETHARGLCHDDVKPNNIFIGDNDDEWLLGDLGNVREVSHPYHSSRIWRVNHALPDCRANDVLRALKTYLQFLRTPSQHSGDFSAMLFEAREPWARLYWMAVEAGAALSGDQVQYWSRSLEQPEQQAHYVSRFERSPNGFWNPFLRLWYGRKRLAQRQVEEVLGMGMSEGWARTFAMTAFFGIPAQICSGPGSGDFA